jgi:hypothetical protein
VAPWVLGETGVPSRNLDSTGEELIEAAVNDAKAEAAAAEGGIQEPLGEDARR